MKVRTLCVVVSLFVVNALFAQGPPPNVGNAPIPDSLTVTVNCPADSIQRALERAAKTLTINIHGVCTEDVYVDRNNVTLHGSDPAVDGIHGTGSDHERLYGLVRVQQASNVTLENLTVSDSIRWGLNIFTSNAVNVNNCNFLRNSRDGVAVQLGAVFITGGTFDNNHRSAVGAFAADLVSVKNLHVTNSSEGVMCINSRCVVDASNITASYPIDVEEEADLTVTGTTISGSLFVSTNAVLNAENLTQTAIGPDPNWVEIDSTDLFNTGVTLVGDLNAYAFSKVLLLGDRGTPAQIHGQLRCVSASQAFLVPGSAASGGVSGCNGTASAAAAVTPMATERTAHERGRRHITP